MAEEKIFEDWKLDPTYQAAQIHELTRLVKNMIEAMPEAVIVLLARESARNARQLEREAAERQNDNTRQLRDAAHALHDVVFAPIDELLQMRREERTDGFFVSRKPQGFIREMIDHFVTRGHFDMPED